MRPLSEGGCIQAQQVSNILMPTNPSAIYSSPYTRARQTVEPLAERAGLRIHEVYDLRERCLAEGRVVDFHRAVEATWKDFHFAHPGGETNDAAQMRAVSVFEGLAEQQPNIVLATHGNLLALLLNSFDSSYDFAFWKSMSFPDIYRVEMRTRGTVAIKRIWKFEV